MKEKILAAFENLGFNLEDNESLGYHFYYEGINFLYMYNEDDEDFLNISVPGIYDSEEDNKENYDALKEKINSTSNMSRHTPLVRDSGYSTNVSFLATKTWRR